MNKMITTAVKIPNVSSVVNNSGSGVTSGSALIAVVICSASADGSAVVFIFRLGKWRTKLYRE